MFDQRNWYRRWLLIPWVLLSGLILVACPTGTVPSNGGNGPPPTTGIIHGTVVSDNAGNPPVAGATIFLESDPSRTVLTNAQGAFTIAQIPLGQSQRVRAESLAFGQGLSVTFTLTADAAELTLEAIRLQSVGPPPPPPL